MSRRLQKALAFTVIVVLGAALSGAMSAAAYVGYAASHLPPPRMGERLPSTIQPDPELGYTLRPNLAVTMRAGRNRIGIYTNMQGIRTAGPWAGRIDRAEIVAIGDSQTFGNVNYDDSYPAQLGKTLGVTVANLGVSGYGPVAAMRRYERFASLKPRVVVLGFYYDSLDRALSECYPGFTFSCMSVPYVVIGRDGTPRIVGPRDNTAVIETLQAYFDYAAGAGAPYAPSRDFYWKVRNVIAGYLQPGRPLDSLLHRHDRDPSHMVEAGAFLVGRLGEEVRRIGGRLVILYIPNYFGAKVIPPPAYLVRTARALGVPFVDLTPALEAAKARGPDAIIIPGDGHLNPWANAVAADMLAAELRRDRLLEP